MGSHRDARDGELPRPLRSDVHPRGESASANRASTSARAGSRGSAPTTARPSWAGRRGPTNTRSITSAPRARRAIPTCSIGSRPWHSTWRVPTSGFAASPTCGRRGGPAEARSAGNRARYLLEAWATDTVQHALHACGARGLIRPSPLERIYRDLSFYVLHDNSDQVLATIGREVLGQPHDASFFNSRPARRAATRQRPGSPD